MQTAVKVVIFGHKQASLVLQEGEAELLERLQALAPQYRTRPSALLPLVRATGSALGVLSAVLPRPYSEAIKGARDAQLSALRLLSDICCAQHIARRSLGCGVALGIC